MKNQITIILAFAAMTLAAIFSGHGERTEAKTAGGSNQTKIVYTCFTGNSTNGNNNLCVMNADGSEKYQLADPDNVIRDAYSPRFDVDAEKILFLSKVAISQGDLRYRLAIVNADGTNPLILFDGEQFDANDYSVDTLGFSPDSSKIAFVTYPRNGNPLAKVLWIINSDGTGLTQLYAGDIYAGFPLFTNGLHRISGIQYISFSPDGSKIAVSINQNDNSYDAFLVNADGSGMTRLTDSQDPVSSTNPVFSPDGSKIVFTESATGLSRPAIMDADGTNKIFLGDGGQNFQASFSPDGSQVVYISTRNSETPTAFFSYDIYVVNTDGTNEQRLTFNSNQGRSGLPSFDAFGEKIVFNATPSGFQALEIYTMNPDGASVTALTDSPGEENAGNPSYGNGDLDGDGVKNTLDNCRFVSNSSQVNTDGDAQGNDCDADDDNDNIEDQFDNCPLAVNQFRLAYSNLVDIYAMNADGTNPTRLTPSSATDDEPSFSRDGKRILFTSDRSSSRDEIYVMNADGSNQMRLTNVAGRNNNAVFNPSATKIAFISRRFDNNENLFVMNADGTNQTQLTFFTSTGNFAKKPSFNHDGTRIVFESQRGVIGNSQWDIFTINPDGTGETRLTTATQPDHQPSFSRDGSKIVFLSERDGNYEVYVMNSDGTNQTRLTNTTAHEFDPTFSPDGQKIAFRSFADQKLYLMDTDGTNVRRITTAVGNVTEQEPTFAPQPDADNDGAGDACDASFDANTPAGANVAVEAPNATVNFFGVSEAGITSFTPIAPNQNDLPQGYTLCPTCPAFDITTTAAYTPPITVCLGVPAAVSQSLFLQMRLLHGENGVLIDRTTNRLTDGNGQRFVCGSVSSLSPFILATNAAPTAAQVSISGRVTANGRGVSKAAVTITGANGSSRYALTNGFGFYRFDEVEVGQTYIVSVRHKQYEFSTRAISVVDDLSDVDFENTSQNRRRQLY